jgi:hypothetical protein
MSVLLYRHFFMAVLMKKTTLFSWVFLSFLLSGLVSCHSSSRKVPDVPPGKLPRVQVKIKRYGKALFSLDLKHFKAGLKTIKPQFLPFLNADLDDTANINRLYRYVADTQIRHIYRKTLQVFPGLADEEKELSSAFAHLKYYFPHYTLPGVYTYISDLYYEQPVMKQKNTVVVALDDYLGENFPLYIDLNIPQYHRRCMVKQQMVPDIIRTIYETDFYQNVHSKTLLDHMLEAGKKLYFLDALMPDMPDTVKICYTAKQMAWMEKNRKEVWAVMVRNRFLYSSDYLLINKMTQPGPFSDGFSHDSPPAMATWFGWQMVRKYMTEHPKTTLEQLLKKKDAQQFLEGSGYKP